MYARVAAFGELDPYAEGDIDWTEQFAMDVGGAFFYGEQKTPSFGIPDTNLSIVTVDTNVKFKGWSFHGELLYSDLEEDTGAPIDIEGIGTTLQAGYFIVPKKFELALRYGYADCDDGKNLAGACAIAPSDDVNEVSVSANYFWWEHSLKAQVGYEYLENNLTGATAGSDSLETNRFIVQLSSWF